MQRHCYVVYAVTKHILTGKLDEFVLYNCFETYEQAVASLRYEADVCRIENGEEVEWIDDATIKLPTGCDPNYETFVYVDGSVVYHDNDEPRLAYRYLEVKK